MIALKKMERIMNKEIKEKIKETLSKLLSKKDNAQFFLTKGLKNFSNTVVVKNKKNDSLFPLQNISKLVKEVTQNQYIEFLDWADTVGNLIPKKNIYKIPFFKTDNIKEHNQWRVCPTGEHWVRRHDRHRNTIEDVDGHCRKNPSKKDLLKNDEIQLIAEHTLFKNPLMKVSSNNLDEDDGNKYDDLISGWTAYWNDIFKTDPPLHPNYVKVLMKTESSFNEKSINPKNSKKNGPARGLMQITERTQRQLSGLEKELNNHFVIIEGDEIWNPNINIAAGVRWLFRKREILKAKLKRDPSWREVLMEYKGKTGSKTEETKRVRLQLEQYLNQLGM